MRNYIVMKDSEIRVKEKSRLEKGVWISEKGVEVNKVVKSG